MVPLPEPISHIVLAIWQGYAKRSNGYGDSRGVSMSTVANECERAIWYTLRWAAVAEEIDGQKQRRFDTGNIEEERLLDDLENAGMTVERTDPATGAQFRIELADGWLRGKMDGRVTDVPGAPKAVHVVEAKSHNERSFKELVKKKLLVAKPDHYAQCQAYMRASGLQRTLYIAVNKNTDELYAERIAYDAAFGERLEAKVRRIVGTDIAPLRLFDDPNDKAAYVCNWCPARPQCHENAFARVNCRTCMSAELRDGAELHCSLFDKALTYDEQQAGCSKHRYLPSLVPGEQVDADPQKRTVTYTMHDGSTWVDGNG